MNKRKTNGILTLFLIALAVFSIFILSRPLEMFSVHYTSGDKEGEDTLYFTEGMYFSQSSYGTELPPLELQSSIPFDESSRLEMSFRAVVSNPFDSDSTLEYVDVYLNGDQYFSREYLSILIREEGTFLYQSSPLPIEGEELKRNTLSFVFTFKEMDQIREIQYDYNFLSLTECISDSDCTYDAPICDINNVAGLSEEKGVTVCTQGCNANIDCPDELLCKRGYCGY